MVPHATASAPPTHLLFLLAKGEARSALLNNNAGDTFGARPSGPAHDHIGVRLTASTDEGLQDGQEHTGLWQHAKRHGRGRSV